MVLDVDFIKSVIPTAVCKGKSLRSPRAWTVDSRTVQEGDMFIALSGAKTDGHAHVAQACERGALGAVIAQSKQALVQKVIDSYPTKFFIIVDDPYAAICQLAEVWRKQFTYPVVGITGSAGKTTTKDMLANIAREAGMQVVATHGTQNTLIGISLNILQMRADHTVAIFEMGISKRGEMARLAQLVKPTIAVITSIGHCHLEGIGLIYDVAVEKRDIFAYLPDDGIGIIDGDQPLLAAISYRHPSIKFGKKMTNQIQARKIQHNQHQISFQLKLYQQKFSITLATENSARIYNALAASAAAHALGISAEAICKGIQKEVSVAGRFRRCPLKDVACTIVDDSYNANPESMKAALEAFERMQCTGKKIAVLGDMRELGVNTPFWHRQLGRFLRKVPSVREVIFVGESVQWAQRMIPLSVQAQWVKTWQDAVPLVKAQVTDDSLILIKGSLGLSLGKLVDALQGSGI